MEPKIPLEKKPNELESFFTKNPNLERNRDISDYIGFEMFESDSVEGSVLNNTTTEDYIFGTIGKGKHEDLMKNVAVRLSTIKKLLEEKIEDPLSDKLLDTNFNIFPVLEKSGEVSIATLSCHEDSEGNTIWQIYLKPASPDTVWSEGHKIFKKVNP